MNTITPNARACPLCGGTLSPADAGARSQCDNCGAKVNLRLDVRRFMADWTFDGFVREVMRRAPFGRAWCPTNLREHFDAGLSVDEVLAMRPEGR